MLVRPSHPSFFLFFFFNDTATTEIYTLSLHDALPILGVPDTDELGDQRRTLLPLDLDGHLGRDANAVARHLVGAEDPLAQADARSRGHGADEANLVRAVVDAPAPPADLEQRGGHSRDQRQREISVSDRLTAGHLAPGPLDVHVNPLVVAP